MSAANEKSAVLVVGGGIGGLSTALALSRKGIPVQVLEQAAEFKEIGAGIQLGPNVFRMFEVLGLTDEVFRWAAFPEALEMRDSITGEIVVEMRIDALRRYSPRRLTRPHPRCLPRIEPHRAYPFAQGRIHRGQRQRRYGAHRERPDL
jgi:3-hydroxybenzoate 6-monooxygenase